MRDKLLMVRLRVWTDCEVVSLAREHGSMEIVDVRPVSSSRVRHLVKAPCNLINELLSRSSFMVKKHSIYSRSCLAYIDKEPCNMCRILYGSRVFLTSAVLDDEGYIVYSFLTDREGFYELTKMLKREGIGYQVVETRDISIESTILTPLQEKVLYIALETGFFDYPRKITLKELANRLGLSPSTLNEIIRRGLKKLLERHFNKTRKYAGSE